MTTIAWDGSGIAADRQSTSGECRSKTSKLWLRHTQDGPVVLAISGCESAGRQLVLWFENGANPEQWPDIQNTDDWARLIVASKRKCVIYEKTPIPMKVLDKFSAWGSGRDFALGAMAMGADARRAVKAASRFDILSGMGVEGYYLG